MANVQVELPPDQFSNVVRWIKRSEPERVQALHVALSRAAERLCITAKPHHAVAVTPQGSDHFDNGSINEWLSRVTLADRAAKRQIRALLATAQTRLQ